MINPWVMDNTYVNIIQIQHGSEELWPGHTVRLWVRCDLGLGDMALVQPWHTLRSWSTIMWNIIQIQHGIEELWPRFPFWNCDLDIGGMTHFLVCVHCDFDLWDMTLGQGHGHTPGSWTGIVWILSRSNMAVRSYGPDTNFWYVCTMTFAL